MTDGEISLKAQVPGCVYLDLLREKRIPDPFYGTNEKSCYWVSLRDWEYRRHFTVTPSEMQFQEIRLVADMLDTICDVFLNGELIGKGENCHIRYEFPVKDKLKAGENELLIRFRSPVLYVKERQAQDPCPINWNGQRGINHIRKPQYHFGWDWGPELPPVGISKDICLEFGNGIRVEDFQIRQRHEDGAVRLLVSAQLANCGECTYALQIVHPNGKTELLEGKAEEKLSLAHTIADPELWFTSDLSDREEQPLYQVNLTVFREGETVAEERRKIGLRQIRLRREKDEYGSNFQFEINGVPLFIKGANVIPSEEFITRDFEERIRKDIDACRFSHFNLIRMWGGGYYSSDLLLDLCDRYGILVWQDFAFACQPYPFYNPEFLANVQEEVRQTVRRMRHHACLAVWCGNNETEAGANHWIHIDRFREATEFFFWKELPRTLQELDADTPYTPGSPIGDAFMQDVESDDCGDNHLWQVWHGLKPLSYYRSRKTRFCSEFGFESLPNTEVLQDFLPNKKLTLKDKALAAHQKCKGGNLRMEYYVLMHRARPKTFEGFVYLSQICQSECIRDATEFWRRNKDRCHGSVYWHLNDCWPACSWAGKDYYNNYKALQYGARRCFAPIIVSVDEKEEGIDVFVINDTRRSLDAELEYFVFDFEGGARAAKRERVSVRELQNVKAISLTRNQLLQGEPADGKGVHIRLTAGGEELASCNWFFLPENELHFPKNNFRIHTEREGDRIKITVQSDTFARFVQLKNENSRQPFTDNFFDILPGETKVVYQNCEGKAAAQNTVSAHAYGNLEVKKSKLFTALRFRRVKRLLKKYPI